MSGGVVRTRVTSPVFCASIDEESRSHGSLRVQEINQAIDSVERHSQSSRLATT